MSKYTVIQNPQDPEDIRCLSSEMIDDEHDDWLVLQTRRDIPEDLCKWDENAQDYVADEDRKTKAEANEAVESLSRREFLDLIEVKLAEQATAHADEVSALRTTIERQAQEISTMGQAVAAADPTYTARTVEALTSELSPLSPDKLPLTL